jgi:SRSO17 transposase
VPARIEDGSVVDGDAVSFSDLKEWSSEFENVLNRIDRLFVHPGSRKHAEQYLRGLLAPIERKNGWTIAEHVGEKEPKAMQRFLNLALWDADELRDRLCEYTIEHLNDPRGILVADPTGFAKKGKKSAGVQRQYSGTLGRVDNCQIGTFLAYVTSNRDRVLLDRELYIPQDSWCGDPDRCAEAAIPQDLTFTTRPMQVMAMVERARWSELPFAWCTADEEFGQNPRLRAYLEEVEISYVMAIPKTPSSPITPASGP